MRGLTSIVAAFGLLTFAFFSFAHKGLGMSVFVLGAAAFVLFYRGMQGNGLRAAAGDASQTIDFIRNPSGAIVESAFETLGGMLTGDSKPEDTKEPAFDPDAAIARYMANRQEPVPPQAEPPAQRPQFGRKGL